MKRCSIQLLLVLLLTACSTAVTPTVIETTPVPSPEIPEQTKTLSTTPLIAGPENNSFQVIQQLEAGTVLTPLGIYFDFVKVETSDHLSGFVQRASLTSLPAELPELGIQDIPWIPLDVKDHFISEATTLEDENILVRDINQGGTNIEGGSIPLTAPFRIRMSLSLQDVGTGYANVQLIGTPKVTGGNWWERMTRMDIGVNARGTLQVCLRDGTSENCALDKTLSLRADKPFSIVFDDPQGKVFHVLDEQGKEKLSVKVDERPELNLPNGFFPDSKVWLGAWAGERTSILISGFSFEYTPDGKWEAATGDQPRQPFVPTIELEEEFIKFINPENGSGPLWSHGSSVIARRGESVFVSMIQKQAGWSQPNNVKCEIFQRTNTGWELLFIPDQPTREPCPLGLDDSKLYVSTNPSLGNVSQPEIKVFTTLDAEMNTLTPEWEDGHQFNAWSYRGLGMDAANRELLLLNISDDEAQYWSYLDSNGVWSNKGTLEFPRKDDVSGSLRLAYPNVALKDQQAYVMGMSDIIEPDPQLKDYMLGHSGDFVYVFRQIYYAWNADITSQKFSEWLPLASVEPYGQITNHDIWLAPDGTAHFLWLEQAMDNRLSDLHPEIPDTQTLWHAVIKDGKIVSKDRVVDYDTRGIRPNDARFFAAPDNRLFVIFSCYEQDYKIADRIIEIYPGGGYSESVKLPLQSPLEVFTIASQRNGSSSSPYVDIIGLPQWDGNVLNYVRIKIE